MRAHDKRRDSGRQLEEIGWDSETSHVLLLIWDITNKKQKPQKTKDPICDWGMKNCERHILSLKKSMFESQITLWMTYNWL